MTTVESGFSNSLTFAQMNIFNLSKVCEKGLVSKKFVKDSLEKLEFCIAENKSRVDSIEVNLEPPTNDDLEMAVNAHFHYLIQQMACLLMGLYDSGNGPLTAQEH